MQKIKKSRHWAFIVYPESAPENWQQEISKTGISFAVSPLHDADLNADESEKKAHWHVLVTHSGPTTQGQMELLTSMVNATVPQIVHSLRGYYRYFTHKDNPEKTQYLETNIEHFNGFAVPDYTEMTAKEKLEVKRKLLVIISSESIYEYSILIDFLSTQDELQQEFFFAVNNTMFLMPYLTSRRYRLKELVKGERNWLYKHESMPSTEDFKELK